MLGASDAFSKARTVVMADILSFDGDKVMAGGKRLSGHSYTSATGCLDMEVRCNPQDGP
jgi:hypothetical protein